MISLYSYHIFSRCYNLVLFPTLLAKVLDVYDCSLGLHRIGPFNYEPLRGVDLWLEQSDEFILQHLSTSPEVEPPHFSSMVTMKVICALLIFL